MSPFHQPTRISAITLWLMAALAAVLLISLPAEAQQRGGGEQTDTESQHARLQRVQQQLERTRQELTQSSRAMERMRLNRAIRQQRAARSEAAKADLTANEAAASLSDQELAETRDALRETQRQLEALNQELGQLNQKLPGSAEIHTRVIRLGGDRPMVGIVMESADLAGDTGVRLRAVTPGGPAEQAGLRSGDEIIAVDGEPVDGNDGVNKVYRLLKGMEEGDQFTFSYRRGDEVNEVEVVAKNLKPEIDLDFNFDSPRVWIDELHSGDQSGLSGSVLPELLEAERLRKWADNFRDFELKFNTEPGQSGDIAQVWRFAFGWSGLELVELNPDLGSYFGTEVGALVVSTSDNIDSDLKAGDVIIELDGSAIDDPKQAMRVLGQLRGNDMVTARVLRNGEELTLELAAPSSNRGNYFYQFKSKP